MIIGDWILKCPYCGYRQTDQYQTYRSTCGCRCDCELVAFVSGPTKHEAASSDALIGCTDPHATVARWRAIERAATNVVEAHMTATKTVTSVVELSRALALPGGNK